MHNNTTIRVAGLLLLAACGDMPRDNTGAPDELSAQPGVVFELGLWPGEGIPEFVATGEPLLLRGAPRTTAAVHDTVYPTAGDPVSYDATSYQTITAAEITVRQPDSLPGRDFGEASRVSGEEYRDPAISEVMVAVDQSSELLLLQHRAEGSCLLSIDDRVLEAATCPTFDTVSFAIRGEPETSWWIHVNVGPSAGWLEFTDDVLTLTGRRF